MPKGVGIVTESAPIGFVCLFCLSVCLFVCVPFVCLVVCLFFVSNFIQSFNWQASIDNPLGVLALGGGGGGWAGG